MGSSVSIHTSSSSEKDNDNPDPQLPKKSYHNILKYSGLAFQMIAMLLVLTFVGYKIDQYFGLNIPVFMIVFILAGLVAYIYKLIKSI